MPFKCVLQLVPWSGDVYVHALLHHLRLHLRRYSTSVGMLLCSWLSNSKASFTSVSQLQSHTHAQAESKQYIHLWAVSFQQCPQNSFMSCKQSNVHRTVIALCERCWQKEHTLVFHAYMVCISWPTYCNKGCACLNGEEPVALLLMCGRWEGSPPAAYPEVLYWGEGCLNVMHSIGGFAVWVETGRKNLSGYHLVTCFAVWVATINHLAASVCFWLGCCWQSLLVCEARHC